MRVIPDQLSSRNLVPFKKRHDRYKIPGMTSEEEVLMDRVDPDLSPEEQSYVRHYLGYADALIRGAEENTLAKPSDDHLPESALSTEKPLKHQRPAGQPAAKLADESSPATNHRPARAA